MLLTAGGGRDLGWSRMLGSFSLCFSHHNRYWAHCDSDLVTVTNVTIISYDIIWSHVNEHLSPDSDHKIVINIPATPPGFVSCEHSPCGQSWSSWQSDQTDHAPTLELAAQAGPAGIVAAAVVSAEKLWIWAAEMKTVSGNEHWKYGRFQANKHKCNHGHGLWNWEFVEQIDRREGRRKHKYIGVWPA